LNDLKSCRIPNSGEGIEFGPVGFTERSFENIGYVKPVSDITNNLSDLKGVIIIFNDTRSCYKKEVMMIKVLQIADTLQHIR
jgi:hypothetical protein